MHGATCSCFPHLIRRTPMAELPSSDGSVEDNSHRHPDEDVGRPISGEIDLPGPYHIWSDLNDENPKKRVIHHCEVFVSTIDEQFMEKLERTENKANSSIYGNFVTRIDDAGTISVVLLGIVVGVIALASSAVFSGASSLVGAAVIFAPFIVKKVIQKRQENHAKNVNRVLHSKFLSNLRAVVRDAANELSRIFEYQLNALKDESQVKILAKCAVKLMLDLNGDETNFGRDTLLRKVLQDGKLNENEKLKTKDDKTWSALGLFRKPGLRLGNPGEFQFKVKDGCRAKKYGYRGQFLEMKNYTDEHGNDQARELEELCNECSDEECIKGEYFVKSSIDKKYQTKSSCSVHSTYLPVHILVRCPKVLDSFTGNLNAERSLSNFLKNKFNFPKDHTLLPVYRQHSPRRVPNLSGVDLSGTDLSHAILRNSSLQQCTFTNCRMLFADLSGAKMSGSTFTSTLIVHSYLMEAGVACCEWKRTHVLYSRVDGADLSRARSSVDAYCFEGTNVCDAMTGGTGPTDLDGSPVSNCNDLNYDYYARENIDVEVQRIQKGKPILLHGTMGTGKTSTALHLIELNKQRFSIRWFVDVSSGEDAILASLTDLAERLRVSYDNLFQTIQEQAMVKEIIFLLDNMSKPSDSEWFTKLWNIRHSICIIITSNEVCLDHADVKKLLVDRFDEAVAFLKDVRTENAEDVWNLCEHFGWSVLGLTAAKSYMMENELSADEYLGMQYDRVAAFEVRQDELSKRDQTLYSSVSACLEEVDESIFQAFACVSLISHQMIPEFLLICQISSGSRLTNMAKLYHVQDQLKSLLHIAEEKDIRFFSFHAFTKYVIRGMIDKKEQANLLYTMAGILVRHFSKDNRFSKGNFLQRIMRDHANLFLQQWGNTNADLDDRTSIALARLSELVGFVCTQEKPFNEHKADDHFGRARTLLHDLCGIRTKDLQPTDLQPAEGQNSLSGTFAMNYGITDNDVAVSQHLFTLLSRRSSELSLDDIKELVFLRAVDKQDVALFPKEVRINEALKKKIKYSYPLSVDDVEFLVQHGVAHSDTSYRELFLPELYVSVIYTFGRNYFYKNATTTRSLIHQPRFYVDLLKLAYCLAREISKRMDPGKAVLHEYLAETNGLLYLLVNDDYVNKDGECVKKEKEVHRKDLKNAIYRYQQLIDDEKRFFERGMLKKTKDDAYSKIVCHRQILVCLQTLITYEDGEDREEHIKAGNEHCDKLLQLLRIDADPRDRKRDALVQQFRYFNLIAKFYSSINNKGPRLIKIRMISAEYAKEHDFIPQYVEALVELADIFSRIGMGDKAGATHVSTYYVKQCNSMESCREIQRREPRIKEKILDIQRKNLGAILMRYALLRRGRVQDSVRDSKDPDGEQSDVTSSSSSKNASV